MTRISSARLVCTHTTFVLCTFALCFGALQCSWLREAPPASPRAVEQTDTLVRCTFDGTTPGQAPALERAFRLQIRSNRLSFAVRAGGCLSQVDQAAIRQDPRLAALVAAWSNLLPIIQSSSPDEIAMEREIRHISQQFTRVMGSR